MKTGDVIQSHDNGPVGDIIEPWEDGLPRWLVVRWRHSGLLGYIWEEDSPFYKILKEDAPPVVGSLMQIGTSKWELTDSGWKYVGVNREVKP